MKYNFWIVAVGSSAGGLNPLKEMISALNENALATFIIIPHLLRDIRSNMDSILSKYSNMPVIRATQSLYLEPHKIYILPENKVMTVKNRLLLLRERRPDEIINNTIDAFFTSLAFDAKEKAVGVVLSGVGNDGLMGSKEIEKYNGVIYVQDPNTAEFSNMPRSIIESDTPDAILSPREIGRRISQHTGLVS